MTNKEKYQRTFSTLHASDDFLTEVTHMNTRKRLSVRRLVCICAAAALFFAIAAAAYASDAEFFFRIPLTICGKTVEETWEKRDGKWHGSFEDADGTIREFDAPAVIWYNEDGTVSVMTDAEDLNAADLVFTDYRDDGTVWISYHGKSYEVTDQFDEDGICYLHITDDRKPIYITLKYRGGYAWGPCGFPKPSELQ